VSLIDSSNRPAKRVAETSDLNVENEVNEAPMDAVKVLYRVSDGVGVSEEFPLGEPRTTSGNKHRVLKTQNGF
jgi:hypothetical protein